MFKSMKPSEFEGKIPISHSFYEKIKQNMVFFFSKFPNSLDKGMGIFNIFLSLLYTIFFTKPDCNLFTLPTSFML